ncbi:hypothetical protein ATCC90586_006084 [Pythium insidiosum]|nr:hypothetical protein ATCC90586_006084 [Pythium insidiosum]
METIGVLLNAGELLKAIYGFCEGVHEHRQLVLRVHARLAELLAELERQQERGVPLSADVLDRYRHILEDFARFLERHQRKNVVSRIAGHRKIVDFRREDLAWKKQFELDAAQQRARVLALASDHVALLRELNTMQKKREALTVWTKQLALEEPCARDNSAVARAYDTLVRHSQQITVQPPEDWFLHADQVEIDALPIGCGAFGQVYLGLYEDHTQVAVKCLPAGDERMRRDFREEIRGWWAINHHQFVLKMFGACDVSDPPFIVCEYAPFGSLDEFLLTDPANAVHLWRLLYEAAQGLAFLHRKRLVHGDVKCNNILVGADGHARVSDFGMSFTRAHSVSVSTTRRTGAVRWKAPECLAGEAPTFASDWYAFGMTVLEAVSGRVPWARVADDAVVMDSVKHGKLPPRPANVSDDAWELIASLCQRQPNDRLEAAGALNRLRLLANKGTISVRSYQQRLLSSHSTATTASMDERSGGVSCESSFCIDDEMADEPIRDDVDVTVLTHWVINGTDKQKETALRSIAVMSSAASRWKLAKSEALSALVHLLTRGTDVHREYAAKALAAIADELKTLPVIVDSGCITPLVHLVASGSDRQKEAAAEALSNIAFEPESRPRIVDAGGVYPLVQLMAVGTDLQKQYAARTLSNVAFEPKSLARIVDAGGVSALFGLLSGTESQQQYACDVILVLSEDPKWARLMYERGALPVLRRTECSSARAARALIKSKSRDRMGLIEKLFG